MSMTIKQAFEKLTMVCGAALKNPFFVQRNLHDAFADIAANIEEGGGSSSAEDVSYDNTDSGLTAENVQAAIDEIVDEMPSNLHTYSTTEQVVGKWIDGTTDVYEKVIEFGALPNNTSRSVAHNISNADIVFIHDAFAINSSGNSFALPKASDAFSYQIDISTDRTNVEIWCGSDRSAYNGYVVLRYTKSTT